MSSAINALFVYGTLQQGQCRAKFWPHAPLKVEPAVIRGQLHDLGPYPALVEGDDLVGGELWHIAQQDWDHTLAVLDEVEDVAVGQTGLYVRRVITCHMESGQDCQAYVYYYSQAAAIQAFPRIAPGADGVCRWRGDE